MSTGIRRDRYTAKLWAGEDVRAACPACQRDRRRLVLRLPTSADLSDPHAITYAFTCECGHQWTETRTLPKSQWPRKQRISSEPNALYRFWNAEGVLLYVGITADPGARWKAHGKDKPWWTEVAKVTVEHFDSRAAVEAAEVAAIKAEKPLYNVTYNRSLSALPVEPGCGAVYVGGPLDGQPAVKNGPGRWSIYRDDDGRPIRTTTGDREFVHSGKRRRYYLHQLRDGMDVYVHATVYGDWARMERADG